MPSLNKLTLPIALVIGSLIVSYALLENRWNNRFKLAPSSSPRMAFKLDSYTGKVELCNVAYSRKISNVLNEKRYLVTCGETLNLGESVPQIRHRKR
jgi:hypothetical protein